MIIPVILATSLFVQPIADTVWWNTVGARVTEHRDQQGASCSLTFFNDNGTVAFQWDKNGETSLTANDRAWNFRDDPHVPVAVQVGGTWLSNGGNSAIIDASANGDTITAQLTHPPDGLLVTADRVEVKTATDTLSIAVSPFRLGRIVDRLRRCQAVIVR